MKALFITVAVLVPAVGVVIAVASLNKPAPSELNADGCA